MSTPTSRGRQGRVAVGLAALTLAAFMCWSLAAAGNSRSKTAQLTDAAKAGLQRAFPGAKLVKVEAEPNVLVMFEVEMVKDGKTFEAEVFVNGEILTVERRIAEKELPQAAARAIAAQAKGAKIQEVSQKEIRATIAISRFPKPKTVYEAEFPANGKTVEVQVDADGKVLKTEVDDDEEDNEDENEREISLADCPAAVKATILKHAGTNQVREVEVQTRNGVHVYEAEWRENGKEVEITVASDGTLLSKGAGDDDKDEDEQDDDD